MTRASRIGALLRTEDGHAEPGIAALIPAAGAILLGVGAANDTGWLAIVGSIVLALGLVGTLLVNHVTVEYGIFGRLDALEGESAGEVTVTVEQQTTG